MHERSQVLTTKESRQGTRDRLNLRVLVISTIATLVVIGLVYFLFAAGPAAALV